ncbi:hypothetical protein ASPVEDRAFT_33398 [Aspergillus versicolor CBS 583.65]|uniref:AMP-dependent synthetase/ligase domain-containing protein n=1 Tax=Aspergillus versicolor CBS 583.65 TaxID=1036611 RepID=A0A1L9Q045_ASPVE|nr:uncharacterized protein ASPVEDRAFT_33398 [Aspergillus versicolor CBS 583.65]OJJ07159.1 hypothetical protein ASPVEDRAFT_33398 [Aspergillus versicolor CBS 583.65]
MALAVQLRTTRIDVMLLTAAALNATVHTNPTAFATLDTLLTGGEAINVQTVRAIFSHGLPRRLVNIYGPTEWTVYTMYHEVTQEDLTNAHVPLPIDNYNCFVVSEDGRALGHGKAGELWIQGAGVARGYHCDEKKTVAAFVCSPQLGTGSSQLHRTGDLVRLNAANQYEFLGRRDNQVKVWGQRVELAAVEAMLLKTGLVAEAVVLQVQVEQPHLGVIILAYVVPVSSKMDTTAINDAFRRCAQQERRKEFIPVDFVVAAIIRVSARSENLGYAYNLIYPSSHSSYDMEATFNLLNKHFSRGPLRGVSYSDWVVSFSKEVEDPLHPLVPMLQEKPDHRLPLSGAVSLMTVLRIFSL